MSPRKELDLILDLIRKYNLPLSPILEYAVNEKKEEYPENNDTIKENIEIKETSSNYNRHMSKDVKNLHSICTQEKTNKSTVTDDIKNRTTTFFSRRESYQSVASNEIEQKRMKAVLNAMELFEEPATLEDIARKVKMYEWRGLVRVDKLDTILKLLPEVEYVKWGKYILKSKIK
ncbi:MAG: hypothetical protein J6M59_10835 [Bacteroidaceae bacterium]|nr:hypothetical protein [Bacteroidaceae bacterium]